jgi:cytidine deaminase
MNDIPWDTLFAAATSARQRAHAPYSGFQVGAAALYEDGTVVPGCNVENASYGLSLCAERNALARAVADGRHGLRAVAVVADSAEPCPPCGMCRQVMAEFGAPTVPVRCRTLQGEEARYTLGELLPHAFTRSFL